MNKKKYWLDKKRNIDLLIYGISVVCFGLLLADLFYEKHSKIFVEDWFGFYSFYGFFVCCGVVVGGKVLRKLVMRSENFYDE